jgi:hypothetical protein
MAVKNGGLGTEPMVEVANMKATAIVRAAHADGVDLAITAAGSIRAKGPTAAVA